ncbi:somatostatin receptor type 4-like [Liolophura sinensis]|uniref:somatostatin receptor type 4-like n=1 Tax=Liolophura sinensis TaxID=3198878 RepID=UPI0031593487
MSNVSGLSLGNDTETIFFLTEGTSTFSMIVSTDRERRVNRNFLPWNNPKNVVSAETRDDVLFVIDCILCPLLTVWGVTGNLMSLAVLLHHNMRGAVDVCLASLAVSDSLFLVTTMIRRARSIIAKFDYLAAEWYNARLFNSMFYLNLVFSRVSTLLTILITLNRFIAVVFPLKAKSWCTRHRMLWAVAGIYVSCILVILPTSLYYEVAEVYDSNLNATKPYLARSALYIANHGFMLAYSRSFLTITFRYIPAVVILVLNTTIVVTIKRTSELRLKMSEGRVTRMLLVISLIFLVCLIPGCAILLGSTLNVHFQFMNTYHNLFMMLSGIALLCEVVNSSVNFIVYMALSKTFSATYRKLFCCFCKSFPKKNLSKTSEVYTVDTHASSSISRVS